MAVAPAIINSIASCSHYSTHSTTGTSTTETTSLTILSAIGFHTALRSLPLHCQKLLFFYLNINCQYDECIYKRGNRLRHQRSFAISFIFSAFGSMVYHKNFIGIFSNLFYNSFCNITFFIPKAIPPSFLHSGKKYLIQLFLYSILFISLTDFK